MKILVVNAGSSSMKYQLIDMSTEKVIAKGLCERIGIGGHISHKTADGREFEENADLPTHTEAFAQTIELLTSDAYGVIKDLEEIDAIGHRIVHGGALKETALVNDEVYKMLSDACALAPLHNPGALKGIDACMAQCPDTPQVVVCDTVFHSTMPDYAYTYALPAELCKKHSIRRYGFHGTSHKYVSEQAAEAVWEKPENLKIVTCHLGNGSSISAVDGGRCVDTSMGFTPLEGVLMGTRCGSIDPAIVAYLAKAEGMSGDELDDLMNKKSGLLGVSGRSADMRDINNAAKEGDGGCLLAERTLTYQIKKYIGSYAAAMNGLDVLVFTAGIGENNPFLREKVCEKMDFLGIKIDKRANVAFKRGEIVDISADDSKVKVLIIPTDEELMIAKETQQVVAG